MKNKIIIMIICIFSLYGCSKTNTSYSENIITVQTNESATDTKSETIVQASTLQNKGEDGDKSSETTASKTTESDLFNVIYEKYYAPWTESEMQSEIAKRKQYRDLCSFYPEVSNYLENVREVRDISSVVEPLYFTDLKIYQNQDFDQVPPLIIHLAKNEIYARHGYIFKNQDLNNYFKGQIWYEPSITPENFKDSVFNKNEQVNLKLLSALDTYK